MDDEKKVCYGIEMYHGVAMEDVLPPLLARDFKNPNCVMRCLWDETQTYPTLTARNAGGAQRMPDKDNFNAVIDDYVVRRVTPTECARLQGMPDWWCDGVPHSDAAEYTMWGNGMALPCVLYVMEGVKKKFDEYREIRSSADSRGDVEGMDGIGHSAE